MVVEWRVNNLISALKLGWGCCRFLWMLMCIFWVQLCMAGNTSLASDDVPVSAEPYVLDGTKDTQSITTFSVTKSQGDQRQYRYLLLPNKLRVLLISDPLTEKSAAALDVFVGHNQNPSKYPGLAHFLEHMLFLGTKKYPLAGEYQTFIRQHGGRYNAYTAPEHTNYFFEIEKAALEPALDRFAQFFIAPLLDAEYIERERKSVHSEYRARIQDESRRTLDVYRQLLNPAHPAAGFSVGNVETLQDREGYPLRDELLRFYQAYYSAELMSLVVLGHESLDDLQRMVAAHFTAIKQREVILPATYPPLFVDNILPAAVTIQPKKELREISFYFPIPDNSVDYQKKPFEYIAHLLGHEGEGSLLSLLKQLGWAEKLSAGVGLRSRHDAFFYITIDLTEKGVRAEAQIPTLILHMIHQLTERGLKEWRYLELQKMADINFHHQENSPPIDRVRSLAQSMHIYAPEDILRGDFLYSGYDEKLIKRSLSFLQSKNMLMVLIAPDVKTTEVSPYYQTAYHSESLVLQALEVKPAIRKRLFFPEVNSFIPNRLSVKDKPLLPAPSESTTIKRVATAVPQSVLKSERVQAWYQQDQLFQTPKTHIYMRLKLPLVAQDVAGAAQAHLFAALVRDQLSEFAYPARLAGLDYSIKANPRGLDIHMAGYSSRQGLLLNKIADSIRKARFTQDRFDRQKAELLRTWRNQYQNSPYQVLLPQIPALQFEPFWNEQALSQALELQTFTTFQKFSVKILQDAKLEALFYGNLYRQEAIKLAALAEHQLLGLKTGRSSPAVRVYQLEGDALPWLYRHIVDHTDQVVLLYVQGVDDSPQDAAHMQLLRQILQPLFLDRLRTERQVGYVVDVVPLAMRKLEGSVFVVQSPSLRESQLMQEIDQFLLLSQDVIAEKLPANQQSLLRRLQEPPHSLAEQAERYWESVLLDDEQFNRRDVLAEAVAAVTPESLTNYYRNTMLNRSRRLWLSSMEMETNDSLQLLENIPAYRKQQKSLIYP